MEFGPEPWKPTAKECGALRDAWGAPLALVMALCDDEHFKSCVEHVRAGEDPRELARPYARKHQPALAAFMRIMEMAASDPRHPVARGRLVAEVSVVAVFPTADLEAGDSRRNPKAQALERDARGVKLIVRRGAGRCGHCGEPLRDPRPRNFATGRPYWRTYHRACERKVISEWDAAAVRSALDSIASQLGGPSRTRARRAKRLS